MLYRYDVMLEHGDIAYMIDTLVKNKILWVKEFIPMGAHKGRTIGEKCESALDNGGSFCVEVYVNLYDDKDLCDYLRSQFDERGNLTIYRDDDNDDDLAIHNTSLTTVRFELKKEDIRRAVNRMYTSDFVNNYNDEEPRLIVANIDVILQLACFNEIRYTDDIILFGDHEPKELVYKEYDNIEMIDIDEDNVDSSYIGILKEYGDVCCGPKENNIINNIASKLSGK